MSARVALIGAGGLGGPVAYALSAAGAHLTLCDHDTVELSNLQRQVQFATADIGRAKVEALAGELCRRGHEPARLRLVTERFTARSADAILGEVDVVVDGSDDLATKFEVNDQAMARGLPFAIGSVLRYSGQILALYPAARVRGCYRCLFEEPPLDAEAAGVDEGASCADAGVLGAVVAVIGGLLARAALALARGQIPFCGPAGGALWVFDDLRAARREGPARQLAYAPRPGCPACASMPLGTPPGAS
jgi:molybdopterin/thiamine biosynthesis adenylyltransferase